MRGKDLAASTFAALTPFVVLAAFTWTKDGELLGFVALLGGGDLLPSTALLCAHSVSTTLRRRELGWGRTALLGGNWILFAVTCVVFAVPRDSAAGYEDRIAVASAVTYTLALALVAVELIVASRAPATGRPAGAARHPPRPAGPG